MTLADRATIGNMAPEYGATMGFFPIDDETLDYLRLTGRTEAEVQLVERYYKEQACSAPTTRRRRNSPRRCARPGHDRTQPGRAEAAARPRGAVGREEVVSAIAARTGEPNAASRSTKRRIAAHANVADNGHSAEIGHGAVVIAAITSCTNTSNPSVMLAAGLLAKKAVERGLESEVVCQNQPCSRLARRDRLSR